MAFSITIKRKAEHDFQRKKQQRRQRLISLTALLLLREQSLTEDLFEVGFSGGDRGNVEILNQEVEDIR